MTTTKSKSEIPWRSLTVAGILLATSAGLDRLHIGPWWLQFGLFAVAILVIGPVGIIFLVRLMQPREERRWKNYRCRELKPVEIADAHTFLRQTFGDEISTVEQMTSWAEVNSRIFWVIENRSSMNGQKFVGFFEVIPIKAGAQRLIQEGKLNGLQLQPQHLTRKRGKAAAVYVGSIVATERTAKGFVLKHLDLKLEEHRRKPHMLIVYARPITDDGYRLMKKYGFRSIHDDAPLEIGEVCLTEW